MEWKMILELIEPRFLIVVAVCWAIGVIVKQTPRVPDWTIVYIVTLVAVLLTIWLIGLSAESVIQGILCGSFAVYGHQLIKQSRGRDKE